MSKAYEENLKSQVLALNLDKMDDLFAEMVAYSFCKVDEKEEGFIDVSSLKNALAGADLDIPGMF